MMIMILTIAIIIFLKTIFANQFVLVLFHTQTHLLQQALTYRSYWPQGIQGETGETGPVEPTGITGATGATGTGGVLNFADFLL